MNSLKERTWKINETNLIDSNCRKLVTNGAINNFCVHLVQSMRTIVCSFLFFLMSISHLVCLTTCSCLIPLSPPFLLLRLPEQLGFGPAPKELRVTTTWLMSCEVFLAHPPGWNHFMDIKMNPRSC